jgi:hypothetical protein
MDIGNTEDEVEEVRMEDGDTLPVEGWSSIVWRWMEKVKGRSLRVWTRELKM